VPGQEISFSPFLPTLPSRCGLDLIHYLSPESPLLFLKLPLPLPFSMGFSYREANAGDRALSTSEWFQQSSSFSLLSIGHVTFSRGPPHGRYSVISPSFPTINY